MSYQISPQTGVFADPNFSGDISTTDISIGTILQKGIFLCTQGRVMIYVCLLFKEICWVTFMATGEQENTQHLAVNACCCSLCYNHANLTVTTA